jgi:hypothetical protein
MDDRHLESLLKCSYVVVEQLATSIFLSRAHLLALSLTATESRVLSSPMENDTY